MQTATCLDALKSDDDEYLAPKVTKVPGGRWYLYSRACYSWTVSPPRHPSLRFLNLDPPSVHQDPKVSTCGSQPAAVLTCLPQRKTLPSWWRLRTSDVGLAWAKALRSQKTAGYWGHQVTFSGNYLDSSVREDDETVGCRYLYAPPSEISGFIKIHLDRWEPDEASSLEREGLIFDWAISEEEKCIASMWIDSWIEWMKLIKSSACFILRCLVDIFTQNTETEVKLELLYLSLEDSWTHGWRWHLLKKTI